MFGNLITAGDYFAYPCRQGSDTYMRTSKVHEVTTRDPEEEDSQRVLKVTTCIAPRYLERKTNPSWRDDIILKKNTLSEFHRGVVVPKSYIQHDERYNSLLEV